MTEMPPGPGEAGARATLDLVRVFAQHGHSKEALKALAGADLLTTATAICFLVSGQIWTQECPACGCPVRIEHWPGRSLLSDHDQPPDPAA